MTAGTSPAMMRCSARADMRSPLQTKLSTHASSPAFSLGGSLPGSSMLGPATAAHQAPGVGAYSIALADSQCLPHTGDACSAGSECSPTEADRIVA
jgi:hypothetical protein